jgi:hypothetical protein
VFSVHAAVLDVLLEGLNTTVLGLENKLLAMIRVDRLIGDCELLVES